MNTVFDVNIFIFYFFLYYFDFFFSIIFCYNNNIIHDTSLRSFLYCRKSPINRKKIKWVIHTRIYIFIHDIVAVYNNVIYCSKIKIPHQSIGNGNETKFLTKAKYVTRWRHRWFAPRRRRPGPALLDST